MRIILYTGKGGVGKTSMAAATAGLLAKEGKNVLIMSTDQAHSLGDCFETKLGNEAVQVADHLFAMEIDAVSESEQALGRMTAYMRDLISVQNPVDIDMEELLVFPGLEELFSMMKIIEIEKENRYDVLILDCAPTGETLSLLRFPEMFGSFIESVLPVKQKMLRTAGPLISKVMKIPMPEDALFEELTRLTARLDQMQKILSDREKVSLRIVTTPEKIVIKEAKRNFTWLQLYDYNVDAVLVNKVYPREALDGYFDKWTTLQEEGLQEIRSSFGEIPLFYMELKKKELKSLPVLLGAAEEMFAKTDPGSLLFQGKAFELEKQESGYALKIPLLLANKEDLELAMSGGELLISVENVTRRMLLPDALADKEVTGAKYEEGILTVSF